MTEMSKISDEIEIIITEDNEYKVVAHETNQLVQDMLVNGPINVLYSSAYAVAKQNDRVTDELCNKKDDAVNKSFATFKKIIQSDLFS